MIQEAITRAAAQLEDEAEDSELDGNISNDKVKAKRNSPKDPDANPNDKRQFLFGDKAEFEDEEPEEIEDVRTSTSTSAYTFATLAVRSGRGRRGSATPSLGVATLQIKRRGTRRTKDEKYKYVIDILDKFNISFNKLLIIWSRADKLRTRTY